MFGSVYSINNGNKKSAIKVIERDSNETQLFNDLTKFDSPFIVKYEKAYSIDGQDYIEMEYVDGKHNNLSNYLQSKNLNYYSYFFNNSGAKERWVYQVRIWSAQILLGLEEVHKNKISHNDLKLFNILLDKNGNIKLTDFGISQKFEISSHPMLSYELYNTRIGNSYVLLINEVFIY